MGVGGSHSGLSVGQDAHSPAASPPVSALGCVGPGRGMAGRGHGRFILLPDGPVGSLFEAPFAQSIAPSVSHMSPPLAPSIPQLPSEHLRAVPLPPAFILPIPGWVQVPLPQDLLVVS